MKKSLTALCVMLALAGCNRAANIGQVPTMSEPRQTAEFEAMANPPLNIAPNAGQPTAAASLWAGGSNALIADRRAATRGDILTVVIEIDDKAEIQNSSGRSRTASDKLAMPAMVGIPQRLANALPDGATPDNLVDTKSSSAYKGNGNISRREKMTLRIAATVLDRLPNGVLHIQGSQEVRVNYEMRELTVTGFVRPTDVSANNEIAYDRIAGARISYGGKGQISDVQQPRYGQQIADIILPY